MSAPHCGVYMNSEVWINGQRLSDASKLTARFDVPYAPGTLRAVSLLKGKVVAETTLKTSGEPKKLKLTADRTSIRADRNDLSYVTVEVVDAAGQRGLDAKIPVRFSITGAGELAGQTSGVPNGPARFQAPMCQTFQDRSLAILRPKGDAGTIAPKAEAEGLEPATVAASSHSISASAGLPHNLNEQRMQAAAESPRNRCSLIYP